MISKLSKRNVEKVHKTKAKKKPRAIIYESEDESEDESTKQTGESTDEYAMSEEIGRKDIVRNPWGRDEIGDTAIVTKVAEKKKTVENPDWNRTEKEKGDQVGSSKEPNKSRKTSPKKRVLGRKRMPTKRFGIDFTQQESNNEVVGTFRSEEEMINFVNTML